MILYPVVHQNKIISPSVQRNMINKFLEDLRIRRRSTLRLFAMIIHSFGLGSDRCCAELANNILLRLKADGIIRWNDDSLQWAPGENFTSSI